MTLRMNGSSRSTPETAAARLMRMDDRIWLRHANPWSVWTRFTTVPILSLAIWSREWVGWYSLVGVALALAWIWLNPRVFPPVRDADKWASKGVLGERIYLRLPAERLPADHVKAARILSALSAAGLPVLAYGLIVLEVWATAAGILLVALSKAWFVDRMVWLYEDVERAGMLEDAR